MARKKPATEPAPAAARDKPKRRSGRPKKQDRGKAEIERQEKIAEALDYRRQGYTYRQIAESMGVHTSTAYGYVQAGLEAITLEPAQAVQKLILDRLDEVMQRLMGMLGSGDDAPPDVVDQILKVNDKIAHYHGLTGGLFGGGEDDGGEGDEAQILLRIRASAPVLRPDGPTPPNPIL